MSKGRKGNIRKRKADSDDEGGGGGGSRGGREDGGGEESAAPARPPAAAAATKGKKKDKALSKGLSFGGEGDGEDGDEDSEFVLKKKKPKVRSSLLRGPLRPAPSLKHGRQLLTLARQERKAAGIAFQDGSEREGKAAAMGSYYAGGSYTDADMVALSKNARSIGGKPVMAPPAGGSAFVEGLPGSLDGGFPFLGPPSPGCLSAALASACIQRHLHRLCSAHPPHTYGRELLSSSGTPRRRRGQKIAQIRQGRV